VEKIRGEGHEKGIAKSNFPSWFKRVRHGEGGAAKAVLPEKKNRWFLLNKTINNLGKEIYRQKISPVRYH